MKKFSSLVSIPAATLLLTLAMAQISYAGSSDGIGLAGGYPHTISVYGEGKASVSADKATISLSIDNSASSARAAKQKNNDVVNALRTALSSLGVSKDDVKIVYYNSYKSEVYSENSMMMDTKGSSKPSTPKYTYNSNYTLSVSVKDVKKVNDVLDKLSEIEQVNMNGVTYALTNNEKAQDEARVKAMKDAESKANKLAKLYNIKLGQILNLSESSYSNPYDYSMGFGQSDQVEVTVSISIGYEIK